MRAQAAFSLSSCHSKSRFGEDTAADVQGLKNQHMISVQRSFGMPLGYMLQVGEGGAVDAVEDLRSAGDVTATKTILITANHRLRMLGLQIIQCSSIRPMSSGSMKACVVQASSRL